MSTNPVNLGVRFLLEMAALLILGSWGWHQGDSLLRYLLALGVPLLAASLWGTFAVPNDPSRSGRAPVPIPGYLRLLLEFIFFGAAVWMLAALTSNVSPWILGAVVVLHYVFSYDRVAWLLRQ